MAGTSRITRPGFRIGASTRVHFSDDGRWLATLGKRITLWDVAQCGRVTTGPAFAYAIEVDIAPAGDLLAAKNTLGDVLLLTVPHLEEVARFSGRPYGEGAEIRFSPCGRFLVDGSWNGDLVVRTATDGEIVLHERDIGTVRAIACTRDRSTWAYTAAPGILLRTWPFDRADARRICASGDRMALSDDSRRVAVVEYERLVVRNVGSGRRVGPVTPLYNGSAVSWTPDGSALAVCATSETAIRAVDGEVAMRRPIDRGSDVHVAPDGSLVAFGSWSDGFVVPAR